MEYFVSLGEHTVYPLDQDSWTVEVPWDAYPNPVDGTRITGVWARRVSGNISLALKSICPTINEDGSVVWRVEWSLPGSASATTEIMGLVSDGAVPPPA